MRGGINIKKIRSHGSTLYSWSCYNYKKIKIVIIIIIYYFYPYQHPIFMRIFFRDKVRLGEWDLSSDKDCQGEVCSSPVQDIEIEEIIPHENYLPRGKSQSHDISLIRLKEEAKLNRNIILIVIIL